MRNTTEKSVEVNILRHLANCLERETHRQITVLSPSQLLEESIGYDDILHGLPRGWVIAIQFKRPKELSPDYARFKINISQMNVLCRLFPTNNAFYIFSPFPTHLEFIHAQPRILKRSYAVDAHILNRFLPDGVIRTIRVHKSKNEILFSGNRLAKITHNPPNVESFCRRFASHKIGSKTGSPFGKGDFPDFKENYPYYKKSFKKYHLKLKDVFYMHMTKN